MKEFFTVIEAAKELGITRAGVFAAIKAGRLTAQKTAITRTRLVMVISAEALDGFEVNRDQQVGWRNLKSIKRCPYEAPSPS